ncbi:hypothetical protein BGX34_010461 [Mortierella sp. NVP85]|nr:hypothetical protein BGX34_010461 [Mortierella sp. NVP85]
MLRSPSFDYVGEPYHPRSLCQSDNVKKRSATFNEMSDVYGRIMDRKRNQDSFSTLLDIRQESVRKSSVSQMDDTDDDEEDVLQVPARHIAICNAARELRRVRALQNMNTDLAGDMGCARAHGMLNKRVVDPDKVATHVTEAQKVALEALVSSEIPSEAQCGVATPLNSQPMQEECSPVVSTATPIYDEFSLESMFSKWPPCNQEAERGTQQEEYSQTQGEDTHVISFWSVLSSPIQLPSDPEDTSVLEHLEVLPAMTEDEPGLGVVSQVEIADVQDSGESTDASFSEWMQSED